MKLHVLAVVVALGSAARLARADRYEASIHVQPTGGLAWVGDRGASEPVAVPSAGLSVRATYGLRNWLAIEAELGGAALGTAEFTDVPVTIGGGQPAVVDIERTTRTGHLTAAATLRLGVAWIPTVTVGLGGLARWQGDGTVVGGGIQVDGREAGLSADGIGFARVGLDHRINRRLVVGVGVGASRTLRSPAIASIEGTVGLAYYWYPGWW
jgi:hypothetical protein